MKKILASVFALGMASSAFAADNSGSFDGVTTEIVATSQAYITLNCFAEISGLADEFELPWNEAETLLNGGTASGAPLAKYDNAAAPEAFRLTAGCPVTVTATNGLNNSVSGVFVSAVDPAFVIDATFHEAGKIMLDASTDPLDTTGDATHDAEHDLSASTGLGADISTVGAGQLISGRYNMDIQLTITENP